MLDHADSERERITIVCSIPEPAWDADEGEDSEPEDRNNKIIVGEWNEWPDGTLWRIVHVPPRVEWPPLDPQT